MGKTQINGNELIKTIDLEFKICVNKVKYYNINGLRVKLKRGNVLNVKVKRQV